MYVDSEQTRKELQNKLDKIRQEHRSLDEEIKLMLEQSGKDIVRVQRLKKRKLQLKEQIVKIEDSLIPDIIA